jgi:chemotaxis protein MotA
MRELRSKPRNEVEAHFDNPTESPLFQKFPSVVANAELLTFICDYCRLIIIGNARTHEIEALMDEEIQTVKHDTMKAYHSMVTISEAFPALGIVAAVLGVIKTMGSISSPPEVLGHMIGGALVGTFLGVFVAYGFFGPMAQSLRSIFEAEHKYFLSMKTGLLAHISGNPPVMAIEFARKMLMSEDRPTFAEIDEATAGLPALTS